MDEGPTSFAHSVKATVAHGYRKVAHGWHLWREEFKISGAALTQAIIHAGHPKPGMRVLDVACGPGEAALVLEPLVAPTGGVIAIDLVLEMLPSTRTVGSSIRFGVADSEALPFEDEAFDLVTCRSAIMHFPDAARALSEAYRVLRPGGRAVFSAFGPAEETPAVMTTVAVLLRHSPQPPAPAPGPDAYRFRVPGALSALFTSAGFREVHEEMFTAPCPWPGNATHFWQALPDHAWRVGELLEGLTPETRECIEAEVIAALRRYERDGILDLTAPVVLASGTR